MDFNVWKNGSPSKVEGWRSVGGLGRIRQYDSLIRGGTGTGHRFRRFGAGRCPMQMALAKVSSQKRSHTPTEPENVSVRRRSRAIPAVLAGERRLGRNLTADRRRSRAIPWGVWQRHPNPRRIRSGPVGFGTVRESGSAPQERECGLGSYTATQSGMCPRIWVSLWTGSAPNPRDGINRGGAACIK